MKLYMKEGVKNLRKDKSGTSITPSRGPVVQHTRKEFVKPCAPHSQIYVYYVLAI